MALTVPKATAPTALKIVARNRAPYQLLCLTIQTLFYLTVYHYELEIETHTVSVFKHLDAIANLSLPNLQRS